MDLFAPAWDLKINGTAELSPELRSLVRSISVDAAADEADELLIVATAYRPTGTVADRWAWVGQRTLAPGNLVTVYAGYGTELTALQRFRIVGERVVYGGDGPTVEIRGLSAAARLAEYTQPRAWEGPISDGQIVEDIAADHGLTVDIEATPERTDGRIKPRGESDLVFLRRLCVANGYGPPSVRYDADSDADVLSFRPQVLDTAAAVTFVHDPALAGADGPGTCLDFSAQLDLHGVPSGIAVGGFDPTTQEPFVVTLAVTADGQDPVVLTDPDDVAPYELTGGPQLQARALADSADPRADLVESVTLPATVATVDDAVVWAQRWVALRARAFLTGDATVLGDPALWVGQIHNFIGLAPTHEGLWEVTACRHDLGSGGYRTHLGLARVLTDQTEPTEV